MTLGCSEVPLSGSKLRYREVPSQWRNPSTLVQSFSLSQSTQVSAHAPRAARMYLNDDDDDDDHHNNNNNNEIRNLFCFSLLYSTLHETSPTMRRPTLGIRNIPYKFCVCFVFASFLSLKWIERLNWIDWGLQILGTKSSALSAALMAFWTSRRAMFHVGFHPWTFQGPAQSAGCRAHFRDLRSFPWYRHQNCLNHWWITMNHPLTMCFSRVFL